MTRTRTEFPESVKRAALERAGHRCQDPQCGISEEWNDLGFELAGLLGMWLGPAGRGYSEAELLKGRDAIMYARFRFPRALKPIIKRFQLDSAKALLEIDHEIEDADGGTATLDNAVVRCVFCHYFKTQDRGNTRRRAPKKQVRQFPEQMDVIHTAKVEGLRQMISGNVAGSRTGGLGTQSAPSSELPYAGAQQPRERRHFSDAQFQAAVQRTQDAIDNNDGFFGA